MNFIPSIICSRTKLPVAFSERPYYTFYSEELGEDLYTIEVDLNVSEEAKEEAKYLLENGIPLNFSDDIVLETFVRYSVLFDTFDTEIFKTLTVLHDELEHDTAILVAMLYYKHFQ